MTREITESNNSKIGKPAGVSGTAIETWKHNRIPLLKKLYKHLVSFRDQVKVPQDFKGTYIILLKKYYSNC